MTQHEQILSFFRERGGSATLGEILKHPFGYEFRARATELRKQGYNIVCTKNKVPSLNLYALIEQPSFQYEESGQMRFA